MLEEVSSLFKTTLGARGSHYKIVVKLEEKRGECGRVAIPPLKRPIHTKIVCQK